MAGRTVGQCAGVTAWELTRTLLFAALSVVQVAPAALSWWRGSRYRPRLSRGPAAAVHLVVPCKGAGPHLERHLEAFAAQRYRPLDITFVTESEHDTAAPVIAGVAARYQHVRHVVAGLAHTGSQKIHNLLAAVSAAPAEAEVYAFCDADIEPPPDLLHHLVGALRRPRVTVATGYRWLAPESASLAAQVHTVLSAHMAALAAWPTSQAVWGGTWAIRRTDWQRLGVAAHWYPRLSDDLSLQTLLFRHRARRVFVPRCVSPTGDAIARFPELLDWFGRQVFYTRLYTPGSWWAAVIGILGLGAAFAAAAAELIMAARGSGVAAWPVLAAAGLFAAALVSPLLCTAPRERPLTFARRRWVGLMPLVALVALWGAVRSVFMRRVTWAGVTYTFNRDGTVRTVEHNL
ncbi:MAG: glycosyltransferase family 2 protein [Spirochaetaceae bacterium]|nr:glycosyltransferase family 2 protein [Spirochaetaceae bacterium]